MRQVESGDQDALQRMALFHGGLNRVEVHQVVGVTLFQLRALCDAGLLNRDATGRYRMHELARRYAAEQPTHTAGEVAQLEVGHPAYPASLVQP